MRFVLFSDLHLDAAFRWAPPAHGRRRRRALRDTLANIVALADEVGADAMLAAGDLYEHDRCGPDTAAFLRATLGDAGRPVFVAPGNHDWHGPDSLYTRAAWPELVHVFTDSRLTPVELDDGLTLWGAAHRVPANTPGFLDDGFRTDRGGVHLALFHGSERAGIEREEDGKQPHAPFDASQIPAAGLHHAFVGHYHTPRDADHHTYPGNPDPLTFGEQGPRGAVVIDVDEDGTVRRERRQVAVTRCHDITVDVTGCTSAYEVRDVVRQALTGLTGVARVSLGGSLTSDVELHPADVGDVAHGLDAVHVRVDEVRVGYDIEEIRDEQTVRGRFVRDVLAAGDLDEAERHRVLVTGLRALEGRDDLEVV